MWGLDGIWYRGSNSVKNARHIEHSTILMCRRSAAIYCPWHFVLACTLKWNQEKSWPHFWKFNSIHLSNLSFSECRYCFITSLCMYIIWIRLFACYLGRYRSWLLADFFIEIILSLYYFFPEILSSHMIVTKLYSNHWPEYHFEFSKRNIKL